MMSDNDVALRRFAEEAGVETDAFGRGFLEADVDIRMGGHGAADTARTRISFASGDREQVVVDETPELIAGSVPLGYNTDFGEWTSGEGRLRIAGVYKGREYLTTIAPSR